MICPPQKNCKPWTHQEWHERNNISLAECADCRSRVEIRHIHPKNKDYAACNSYGCTNGADYEQWVFSIKSPRKDGMIRNDCRCADCSQLPRLSWKVDTALEGIE